jgi:hypothetical protein
LQHRVTGLVKRPPGTYNGEKSAMTSKPIDERAVIAKSAEASARRRKRLPVLLAAFACFLLLAIVAGWMMGGDASRSFSDRVRHGWDNVRRGWDERRRAWEDQRRAEEQARREREAARQQVPTAPASDGSTNQ